MDKIEVCFIFDILYKKEDGSITRGNDHYFLNDRKHRIGLDVLKTFENPQFMRNKKLTDDLTILGLNVDYHNRPDETNLTVAMVYINVLDEDYDPKREYDIRFDRIMNGDEILAICNFEWYPELDLDF